MDNIVHTWQSDIRSKLRKLIQDCDPASAVDPLELATTMFSCRRCSETFLRFPSVLTHKCQRPASMEWKKDEWEDVVQRRSGMGSRLGNPDIGFALSLALWPCGYSEPAHHIVRLCGMDPAVVTAQEMDALDVRLVQWECNHDMACRCEYR